MDYVCIVPPNANYAVSGAYQVESGEYYNLSGSFTSWLGYWGGAMEGLSASDIPGLDERAGMDSSYDVTVLCACVRGGMHGCFAEGTKIKLADGSLKRAEEIVKGDMVFNPIAKKAVRVKHVIDSPEHAPLMKLAIGNVTLRVTQTHPMLTQAGLKRANELTLDDQVQGEDGQFHRLVTIEELPIEAGQYVINFELEAGSDAQEEHMLIADGIVTGDMVLQLKLNQ